MPVFRRAVRVEALFGRNRAADCGFVGPQVVDSVKPVDEPVVDDGPAV